MDRSTNATPWSLQSHQGALTAPRWTYTGAVYKLARWHRANSPAARSSSSAGSPGSRQRRRWRLRGQARVCSYWGRAWASLATTSSPSVMREGTYSCVCGHWYMHASAGYRQCLVTTSYLLGQFFCKANLKTPHIFLEKSKNKIHKFVT